MRRLSVDLFSLALIVLAARSAVAQPGQPAQPLPPPAIDEIRPGVDLPGFENRDQPRVRQPGLPFQPQLPPELIVPPVSPQIEQKYNQFVPKIIDPDNVLNVLVGRPRIMVFNAAPQRLYIPDEGVARWDVISDTEIAIVGLRPGSTVLSIWVTDPQAPRGQRVLSYLVRVLEDPEIRESLEQIEQQINDAFADSHVELTMVRDRLLVKGEAKDAIVAAQILNTLAQIRSGERGADDVRETDVYIDRDRFIDEENAALRRSLIDPTLLNRAGIVNLLRIPGEQQVMLRVTVAEINRSAMRAIGADMQIGSGNVSFVSLLTGSNFEATAGAGNLLVDTGDFRLALNALRQLNLARTLAEPNLVALNGRSAEFFSGDRVPLPAATAGFGAVGQGVRFDNVGVSLSFTPFIVDRDRVRLEIFGRVSALDDSQGTTNVGGSQVSNQNARTFQTTVDLREGQTMALAGLLLNTMRTTSTKVPFAGDLPFLGTLFSNDSESYTEQELVVIVTPELVHPLEACETPPLPGADVFQPTDVGFYLANKLEGRRSQDYRSTVRTDWDRQWRYQIHCNDRFIIGPTGHSYNCCGTPPRIHFDPKTIEPGFSQGIPFESTPTPIQVVPEEIPVPQN